MSNTNSPKPKRKYCNIHLRYIPDTYNRIKAVALKAGFPEDRFVVATFIKYLVSQGIKEYENEKA